MQSATAAARSGQATTATLSCAMPSSAASRSTSARHRLAERAADVGQARHGAGAVLGLGEQVGGQPRRLARLVGDHEHLAGAGQAVDGDLAHDLALGLGDVGVAGADDDVAARHGGGAEGHGGDRLGAADREQVGDAEQSAGGGDPGGRAAAAAAAASRRRRGRRPATCAGMAVMSTEDG